MISIDDGGSFVAFLKNDGTVWTCGDNSFGQLGIGNNTTSNVVIQIETLSNIVAIECGSFHSLAIRNDDTVWAWGWNNEMQLGNDSETSSNVPIQVMGLCSMVTTMEHESVSTSANYTLYPNPANDFISIRGIPSNASMVIYDITGKVVMSKNVMPGIGLDISSLDEGIYSMIISHKAMSVTKKLIVE
ncbi:MAG: T9SS type A sorting domain-containing protein [Flavobacteriales bacterium]|nr:T9SS type A sorting domain-containing protein [Flavobacteriales bacterium]